MSSNTLPTLYNTAREVLNDAIAAKCFYYSCPHRNGRCSAPEGKEFIVKASDEQQENQKAFTSIKPSFARVGINW